MLYNGLQSLNEQYGMKYLCFAFSALYGPDLLSQGEAVSFYNGPNSKKLLELRKEEILLFLWGDGFQKRELLFVSDLVEVMLSLMKSEENKLINVSSGEEKEYSRFCSPDMR